MKICRIHIEHLQLTLPRTELTRTQHSAVTLAKAVATNLANSLERNGAPLTSQQIPKLQIQAPRRQANAAGIASMIEASLTRPSAPAKKAR
jgi:hypothetical protein